MFKLCKILGAIALVAVLFFGTVALAHHGDINNFQGSRNNLAEHATPDELARAREIDNVLLSVVPEDKILVSPDSHYVNFWLDGTGYTAEYRVLVFNKSGNKEVLQYEADSLLASNIAAYYHGISESFPCEVVVDTFGELVISSADPNYESFQQYTTAYVFETLHEGI